MPRHAPAELFGDLEAHCLGAFGVIGPQVDVDEAPAVLEGHLGTQPVDLVVGAGDADDLGAVDARAEDLGPLQIGRHEDVAFQPGRGGVGGDAVGQVARRGAAHRLTRFNMGTTGSTGWNKHGQPVKRSTSDRS